MARIAVGGFLHESNSFLPHTTGFAHFAEHRDRPPLVRGAQVVRALEGGSYALSGVLASLASRHELVALVWANGGADGDVTAEAFERIVGELVGHLSEALPVDAVYLDLHGAMVSADFEDAEGEILRRVRAAAGPEIPIVISLDYHANVTPAMAALADGIVGYRTYPHVDRVRTGERAACVLERLLREGCSAGRALRHLPFLLPLEFQSTLVEPSAGLANAGRVDEQDIVSLSYLAGFPPSDLYWAGPSVVAHARTQAAADRAADALFERALQLEPSFAAPLWEVREGVAEALRLCRGSARPIVIADTQDNPGTGGTGDTTGILHELVRVRAKDALIGYLCDAPAAASAHAAGRGAVIELALGGRGAAPGDRPFEGRFEVLALGDGRMTSTGRMMGSTAMDLGPMALLRVDGVRVAVTSKRMQAYDPAPFHHLGADPAATGILVLKSTCHFRADFGPLAEAVLVVLAPGGYLADPTRYPYRKLRPDVRLSPLGNRHREREA